MYYGERRYKLVIGLDFGTSRSGYAYAFTDDKKIIGRVDWPDQPYRFPKTATHLLYGPDNQVEAWGYSARVQLAHLRKNREPQKYTFVSTFKMQLHEPHKSSADGPLTLLQGKEFNTIDLVADYLRQISQMALADIDEKTAGLLHENEILWCLTVPAIWTDAEKQMMREAAQKAGLISNRASDEDRLLIVLEPEAGALYCQQNTKVSLEVGTRFMVVDCGGGTVDIISYEVTEQSELHQLALGRGNTYGSIYVDRKFQEYFRGQIDSNAVDKYTKDFPVEYVRMMANWEDIKCNFDPLSNWSETTFFPIPEEIRETLQQINPSALSKLQEKQNGDIKELHIPREKMLDFFNPIVDGIVSEVREQFNEIKDHHCDYIFLVGGFAESPIVRERIKSEFGPKVEVLSPVRPSAAIVEGAVAFGLAPRSIPVRYSNLTYGCNVVRPFRADVDPVEKQLWVAESSKLYCNDRFHVFIERGQTVGVDEEVTYSFSPIRSTQTGMSFRFFGTKKLDPVYTDESEVEQIGELTVDMPDLTGGINRSVTVYMYFGRTEINVRAVDLTTGKEFDTILRFSYSF